MLLLLLLLVGMVMAHLPLPAAYMLLFQLPGLQFILHGTAVVALPATALLRAAAPPQLLHIRSQILLIPVAAGLSASATMLIVRMVIPW
jgi:hypothetical protein